MVKKNNKNLKFWILIFNLTATKRKSIDAVEAEFELKELLILVHDQNKDQFIDINNIVWHGKKPPKDQTIKIRLMHRIPNSMLIGASVLATSGIILAIGYLCFNIKFRQHR